MKSYKKELYFNLPKNVTFVLDIIYGFIDPRVKAAQFDA